MSKTNNITSSAAGFFTLSICCLLLPISQTAMGATNSSSLLQQQQQLGVPQALQLIPDISPEPLTALPPTVGDTVTIASIRFVGQQDQVSLFELDALVAEAKGQALDFAGLKALSHRVTDYFKSKGWILTRAYLPQQDLTEGHLTIAIVPGIISPSNPVTVIPATQDQARQDIGMIMDMATKRVTPGKALHEQQLNTTMLLINDLPGIEATSHLQAGTQPGTSEIIIELDETPVLSGMSWLNNYGSTATGQHQGNLNLEWNNPTGKGDQSTLLVTANEGSTYSQLSYSAPIGIHGNRLQASYSNMDYRVISGTGLSNQVKGQANTVKLNWRLPQQRSALTNRNININLEHLRSKDFALGNLLTQKEKNVLRLAYSGNHINNWQDKGGISKWQISASSGTLNLPVDTNNDQYGTTGSFTKLTYRASRLQQLANNLNVYMVVNGQLTDQNLDGSEKIALGGPNAIRAYPMSEASGDIGVHGSLELRYDLPGLTDLGHLQLQAFYDYGRIQLHHNTMGIALATATQENQYSLAGYGLGITLSQQDQYQLTALWARRAGDNPGRDNNGHDADGHNNQQRFWLQANFWF